MLLVESISKTGTYKVRNDTEVEQMKQKEAKRK